MNDELIQTARLELEMASLVLRGSAEAVTQASRLIATIAKLGIEGIKKLSDIYVSSKQEMSIEQLAKYSLDAPQVTQIPETAFEARFSTDGSNKPYEKLNQEEKARSRTFSEMPASAKEEFLSKHKSELGLVESSAKKNSTWKSGPESPESEIRQVESLTSQFERKSKQEQNRLLAGLSDAYPSRFEAFVDANSIHFSRVIDLNTRDNLVPIAFATQDITLAAEFTKTELNWAMMTHDMPADEKERVVEYARNSPVISLDEYAKEYHLDERLEKDESLKNALGVSNTSDLVRESTPNKSRENVVSNQPKHMESEARSATMRDGIPSLSNSAKNATFKGTIKLDETQADIFKTVAKSGEAEDFFPTR